MSNYNQWLSVDVIFHPWHNLNAGLVNPYMSNHQTTFSGSLQRGVHLTDIYFASISITLWLGDLRQWYHSPIFINMIGPRWWFLLHSPYSNLCIMIIVSCNSKLYAFTCVVYTGAIKATNRYLNPYCHSSSTYMWVSRLQWVREYFNQFKIATTLPTTNPPAFTHGNHAKVRNQLWKFDLYPPL